MMDWGPTRDFTLELGEVSLTQKPGPSIKMKFVEISYQSVNAVISIPLPILREKFVDLGTPIGTGSKIRRIKLFSDISLDFLI